MTAEVAGLLSGPYPGIERKVRAVLDDILDNPRSDNPHRTWWPRRGGGTCAASFAMNSR
jgi:hypothetical protein